MLAVVLVIVIGMVRMIGSNAGTVFSQVGSAIQKVTNRRRPVGSDGRVLAEGDGMRLCYRLALLALCTAVLLAPSSLCHAQQDPPEIKSRRMVTKVVPIYPSLAQKMSIAGAVKIEGLVAPNGTVKSAQVLGGHPVLAQAAIDAFRRSKWEAVAHETKEVVVFDFRP